MRYYSGSGSVHYPDEKDTGYIDNMALPVHRWFRFPGAFSALWAGKIIQWYREETGRTRDGTAILDPFAGSGTTVIAAEQAGVRAYGIEAQPFFQRVARTKLLWDTDPEVFLARTNRILGSAQQSCTLSREYPRAIRLQYTETDLAGLDTLRSAWEEEDDGTPASELAWLAITATFQQAISLPAGSGNGDLPAPCRDPGESPYGMLRRQAAMMAGDMAAFQASARKCGSIIAGDARTDTAIPDGEIALVITAAPFPNQYDFAQASLLEEMFWGIRRDIRNVRPQHARTIINSWSSLNALNDMAPAPNLHLLNDTPVHDDLCRVTGELAERQARSGTPAIRHDLMIASYFSDMAAVWQNLRRMCGDAPVVAFVTNDTAPLGIHVPVEEWLARLAVAAGFSETRFVRTRTGTKTWTPRGGGTPVPLKEGILWVN